MKVVSFKILLYLSTFRKLSNICQFIDWFDKQNIVAENAPTVICAAQALPANMSV